MTGTTYAGIRTHRGCVVRSYSEGDAYFGGTPLDPRYDLRNHSPAGFEWSYTGSGPAQLALALCTHALADDARALRVYQEFKRNVLSTLGRDSWTLTGEDILAIVTRIEASEQRMGLK